MGPTLRLLDRDAGESVFDTNPQLSTIWSKEATKEVRKATGKWCGGGDGEILLVMLGQDIVGITGWYDVGDDGIPPQAEIGLRWHGVIPQVRRRGISRTALGHLARRLPRHAEYLYEVAPRDHSKIIEYFCNLGFEPYVKPRMLENLRYVADKVVLRCPVPLLRIL